MHRCEVEAVDHQDSEQCVDKPTDVPAAFFLTACSSVQSTRQANTGRSPRCRYDHDNPATEGSREEWLQEENQASCGCKHKDIHDLTFVPCVVIFLFIFKQHTCCKQQPYSSQKEHNNRKVKKKAIHCFNISSSDNLAI
jgi:hypothetical protein